MNLQIPNPDLSSEFQIYLSSYLFTTSTGHLSSKKLGDIYNLSHDPPFITTTL